MSELYWITVLGTISGIAILLFILSIISFLISIVLYCLEYADYDERYSSKSKNEVLNLPKKAYRLSIILTIIFGLMVMFIPSTNQLYAIYGVGGTIDYLKSNDKAKRLPDKCIDALDKFLDNINKDEE